MRVVRRVATSIMTPVPVHVLARNTWKMVFVSAVLQHALPVPAHGTNLPVHVLGPHLIALGKLLVVVLLQQDCSVLVLCRTGSLVEIIQMDPSVDLRDALIVQLREMDKHLTPVCIKMHARQVES